ncbi:excisionase [bacterium D16-51]|nr:excisionase [bacterium D16-59]RKI60507.1 excisionase [bacterium D16-51]
MQKESIPIWKKYTLSIEEAALYFHIGQKRLRQLVADNPDADYILFIGNRVQIKRLKFEKFVDEATVV